MKIVNFINWVPIYSHFIRSVVNGGSCGLIAFLYVYIWANRTFSSFEELISDYGSGKLHPGDLKPALTKAINKLLQV